MWGCFSISSSHHLSKYRHPWQSYTSPSRSHMHEPESGIMVVGMIKLGRKFRRTWLKGEERDKYKNPKRGESVFEISFSESGGLRKAKGCFSILWSSFCLQVFGYTWIPLSPSLFSKLQFLLLLLSFRLRILFVLLLAISSLFTCLSYIGYIHILTYKGLLLTGEYGTPHICCQCNNVTTNHEKKLRDTTHNLATN